MTCLLDAIDMEELAAFCKKLDTRLLYISPDFLSFLEVAVGGEKHYFCCYDGGDLVGVMPFFKKESTDGVIINSLPWFASHGGCYTVASHDVEARIKLLGAFSEYINAEPRLISSALSISFLEARYLSFYQRVLKPVFVEDRTTQVLEFPFQYQGDTASCSDAFLAIQHGKSRNMVRKSLKQGFTLRNTDSDSAWSFLYNVHSENMNSIGILAKPRSHFEFFREKIAPENRLLLLAELKGIPVAGLLCSTVLPCIEYLVPVVKNEYRSLQPLSFLVHNGLVWALKNGFTCWNFGGTGNGQQSLHKFKAGWGAEDRRFHYIINMSRHGKDVIKNNLHNLVKEFPFYYIFPFTAISRL